MRATAVQDGDRATGVSTSPARYIGWKKVRAARWAGKWMAICVGKTEAEAFARLREAAADAQDGDLLVLPAGESP
jgi:hypothetical protein